MSDKITRTAIPDELDLDADPGYSMDRLIGLGDGIFAFAMTLLAINVDIPRLAANSSSQDITTAVLNLAPEITIFVTSFLLVALYWQVSRRMFHYVIKSDNLLSWLFILQLMFVAFLPVATGLFDTYAQVSIVIFVYAGTLLAIGILGQLMFRHARRAGLVDPSAGEIQLEYFNFRGTFTILVYVVVLIVGVLATDYASYVFLMLFLVYPFLARFFRIWYKFRHQGTNT